MIVLSLLMATVAFQYVMGVDFHGIVIAIELDEVLISPVFWFHDKVECCWGCVVVVVAMCCCCCVVVAVLLWYWLSGIRGDDEANSGEGLS